MRKITLALLALGFVGAMAIGTPVTTKAQGIYIPGVGVEISDRYDRRYNREYDRSYGYYRQPGTARQVDPYGTTRYRGVTCPAGYSNQGGTCKPYRGY